jgi:hypothetical protein
MLALQGDGLFRHFLLNEQKLKEVEFNEDLVLRNIIACISEILGMLPSSDVQVNSLKEGPCGEAS